MRLPENNRIDKTASTETINDMSQEWRPQRDSNPCCRRERAVS